MKSIFLFSISTLLLCACKKDEQPLYNNAVKAPLSVEFDNIAGAANLQLNTATYINAVGENFTVSLLKYYVSNFKLTDINGNVYTLPQDSSYFLIQEGATDEVELSIPEGEYKTLSFVLGVDSLRSTMDISKRTGVLDPAGEAADMYWDINNGYIFFKMEGTSPASIAASHAFHYNVGGFGGSGTATANNLKTFTLDLSARGTAKVKSGKETNIHLMVDILKVLNGSSNASFAATPMINSPAAGIPVANNYTDMIRHDHTEN